MSRIKGSYYDHDRTFDRTAFEGFTEEEIDEIMNPKEHKSRTDAFCDIYEKATNMSSKLFRYGYGIYGIDYKDGKLILTTGNSCD